MPLPGNVTAYMEDPDLAGDLPEWVLAYAQRERLFAPGDRVLVAVSGGPDSIALLHLLTRLGPELHVELGVAHFDHALRGADSQGDADFVADLAQRLGLPFYLGRGQVKETAKKDKVSVQMAARKLRRQFLQSIRKAHSYTKLALGHTADDQEELFWLCVLRGAGLEGLKGMEPATAESVVRPLMAVGKAVLLAWLKQEELSYRLDASNASRAYLRNRVRLDLLPYLKSYNPRLTQTIWRTQALLRDDEHLLRRETAAHWDRVARRLAEDCFALDLNRFLGLDPAWQRRSLRFGVNKINPELILTAAQVGAMLALAQSERSSGMIPLGEDVQVARAGTELHILKALSAPPREGTLLPDGPREIESSAGWRWRLRRRSFRPGEPWPPPDVAWLNPSQVSWPLEARSWRPGDRFWPQGAPGPRKLQDFLVDAKIPRWLRPHLPLMVNAGQVIWVAGLRLAEPVKILPTARDILEITVAPVTADTLRIFEIIRQVRK